jgi:predicted aspartyl protease
MTPPVHRRLDGEAAVDPAGDRHLAAGAGDGLARVHLAEVQTANGRTAAAPVVLDTVAVGPIGETRVSALVTTALAPVSNTKA